jgi:hypothetical protein
VFSIADLLTVAQALSLLTYFIGTAIYALPIPLHGVKKWAPRLIADGIYSLVLITAYTIIVSATVELENEISGSWGYYEYWLQSTITQLSMLYQYLSLAYAGLTSIPYFGKIINSIFPTWVFFSALSLALSYLSFLQLLSLFIYNDFEVLIALGILLIALPFRIGRVIGASFISSAIVFFIGLPYLPNFLENLGLSTGQLFLPVSQVSNTTVFGLFNYMYSYLLPQMMAVTIFGPLIYLTLLASLSIGVASLISGMGGRLPFPIEVP